MKIGFRHRPPTPEVAPVKTSFRHRKVEEPAVIKTSFRRRSVPLENRMGVSLYNAWVDACNRRHAKEPETRDQYYWDETSGRVVFLPWLEDAGLVPWDTTAQYLFLLNQGVDIGGKFKTAADAMGKVSSARDAARHMGWSLTPNQLDYLTERGY